MAIHPVDWYQIRKISAPIRSIQVPLLHLKTQLAKRPPQRDPYVHHHNAIYKREQTNCPHPSIHLFPLQNSIADADKINKDEKEGYHHFKTTNARGESYRVALTMNTFCGFFGM
jgi:hypothetical protein